MGTSFEYAMLVLAIGSCPVCCRAVVICQSEGVDRTLKFEILRLTGSICTYHHPMPIKFMECLAFTLLLVRHQWSSILLSFCR